MVSQVESFSKVLTFKCTRLMQLALDSTDTFTSTRFIGQISALKFINPIAEFKLQYDYFRDLEKKNHFSLFEVKLIFLPHFITPHCTLATLLKLEYYTI